MCHWLVAMSVSWVALSLIVAKKVWFITALLKYCTPLVVVVCMDG